MAFGVPATLQQGHAASCSGPAPAIWSRSPFGTLLALCDLRVPIIGLKYVNQSKCCSTYGFVKEIRLGAETMVEIILIRRS